MSLKSKLETAFKENPTPWGLPGLPGLPSHCYVCEETEPAHTDGCLWVLGKGALAEIARLEQRHQRLLEHLRDIVGYHPRVHDREIPQQGCIPCSVARLVREEPK